MQGIHRLLRGRAIGYDPVVEAAAIAVAVVVSYGEDDGALLLQARALRDSSDAPMGVVVARRS